MAERNHSVNAEHRRMRKNGQSRRMLAGEGGTILESANLTSVARYGRKRDSTVSKQSYQPNPIDTSNIAVSPELSDLIEKLAHNTHEVWAQKRMQDGWTYGPTRNDAEKQHPDMVAYEDLTEGEKSYDREVVTQVVKVILALGYGIVRR
jgi:hypothetical protein